MGTAQRTIAFEKLQGAGNDFIFIDGWSEDIELTASQVQKLCDRHFGIGADGVIVARPPKDVANDGFMDYINADGTLAQMCGNGVRCFAKYVVDHGRAQPRDGAIRVETRAGVKTITCHFDETGKVDAATVDMGAPVLDPAAVPTTLSANATAPDGTPCVTDAMVASPQGDYAFTCVSMGNPHAVTFVDDCDGMEVDRVGAAFESHGAFPEKANVEFATVRDDGIHMRVFERGCGETLACGTGACATAVAAYLTGRADTDNDVVLRGGTLRIGWIPGQSVFMTGPAEFVFDGHVKL